MADSSYLELIQWHDQDKEFFALFVWADDIQDEGDGVVIRLIKEFFLTFFPVNTLICRPKYFEVTTFLETVIVIVR